jgi:hypothetical protein
VPALLERSCGAAGCHAASSPQSGLDLATPGAAARMVGVRGMLGGLLIDPANPEQSLLIRTLKKGGPGARMPIGAPLDDATIACVLSWAQGLSANVDGPLDGSVADGGAQADAGTTTRVAAGALAPYTDTSGNAWSADVGFTGGSTATENPLFTIDKTQDGPLYNGQRYGSFTYAASVQNANYTVTLKFAETFTGITAAGQRQFNVSINGQQVLSNFDIFAEGGGRNVAVDKSFPVAVTNGTVTIAFEPGATQSPKIDAIAIVPK